jgi:hypothetical protein
MAHYYVVKRGECKKTKRRDPNGRETKGFLGVKNSVDIRI